MLQNYHLLRVKYHGATNTIGSRVSITSDRFKQRIYIDYDYSMNTIHEMATTKLQQRGFEIVGVGELKNEYILISTTFDILK